MKIAFDLENTLCSPSINEKIKDKILAKEPSRPMLNVLKDLKYKGHEIVIFTHRPKKLRRQTVKWLKFYAIPYDKLIMDKPNYDLLIDDKAYPPYRFLSAKVVEGYIEHIKKWNFDKGAFRLKEKS